MLLTPIFTEETQTALEQAATGKIHERVAIGILARALLELGAALAVIEAPKPKTQELASPQKPVPAAAAVKKYQK